MSATSDEPGDREERVEVLKFSRAAEFAVNGIMARLRATPGLAAVSGSPGAGQATVVRDLIAAIVITRADRLADLGPAGEAFAAETLGRRQCGGMRHVVTPLNPLLTGAEAEGAWAMVTDRFRAAQRQVALLAAEHARAAQALARLPVLRREAGIAYDAITAAEDTLRTLAGQRVAAERSLRAASSRSAAAAKALDAHARAKPGLRALLATGFGARREWRDRQASLDSALRGCGGPVDAARQAVAEVQAQFAATVHERAAAAATLRRLTVECAAEQAAATRGRERPGGHHPSGPGFSGGAHDPAAGESRRELAAPRADEEFAAARTELFFAALSLHKVLIMVQARRVKGNLNALVGFLGGKTRPGDRAILCCGR